MDIVCPVAHERFSVADVNILEYRLDNCPLVSVPPHGRLGDLDAVEAEIREKTNEQFCVNIVHAAPTIIPASEEGMK